MVVCRLKMRLIRAVGSFRIVVVVFQPTAEFRKMEGIA